VSAQTRLRRLRPEELDDDQRAMYDAVVNGPRRGTPGLVDEEGRLGGPMNTYLHAPAIGTRQQALGAALTFEISLPKKVAELVILTVANDAESSFQLAAHEWMGFQAGLTHDQIEALRERREPELDDPLEQAAYRTTTRLLQNGDLDDDAYGEAAGVLGERGLLELVTLIGYYRLVALQLRVFRVLGESYTGTRLPDRAE
jgi:4-carboxymuconolactone decarboxylase